MSARKVRYLFHKQQIRRLCSMKFV